MKKNKRVAAFFAILFTTLAAFPSRSLSQSASTEPILVADFSDGQMKTKVDDGAMGAWNMNPKDPDQYCKISIDKAPRDSSPSLALDYSIQTTPPQRAKAGVWMKFGDLDLSHYNTIEIELKGDADQLYPKSVSFEIKATKPDHPGDKVSASWIVEELGSDWKTFRIPLWRMNGISNWTDVKEMVITFVDRLCDIKKGRIYVRKITINKTGNELPWSGDNYRRKKIKTSDAAYGKERAELQIKRLYGFPTRLVQKRDFPTDNREFLKVVAGDTWKFFENIVNKETGLPLDTIGMSDPDVLGPRTMVGDFTNITNVGLYMICLPAAEDFGFLTHDAAQARALKVLETLRKMESYRGFFYNYYDTTTMERTTHFISSVDSGWLMAGLIMLRNSYPGTVADRATKLLDKMNLRFFYDPVERQLHHGYYTNIQSLAEYHYGILYTEARAASFIGIAKKDLPIEHWFALARVFPAEWDWQSQKPRNWKVSNTMGQTFYSGNYEWNELAIVPSWGGSMFEALLPAMIIDEQKLSPRGWGMNDVRHAKAQIEYAQRKKYPVWGMSPCTNPHGGYSEFGAKPLGIQGYPDGVVTPHATFLALPFAYHDAIFNLRKLIELYPTIYGEYGFYDSVDPKDGTVSYKYLALDQAMSFLGLANALNPGKLYERFHNDPIIKNGEQIYQAETPLPN